MNHPNGLSCRLIVNTGCRTNCASNAMHVICPLPSFDGDIIADCVDKSFVPTALRTLLPTQRPMTVTTAARTTTRTATRTNRTRKSTETTQTLVPTRLLENGKMPTGREIPTNIRTGTNTTPRTTKTTAAEKEGSERRQERVSFATILFSDSENKRRNNKENNRKRTSRQSLRHRDHRAGMCLYQTDSFKITILQPTNRDGMVASFSIP